MALQALALYATLDFSLKGSSTVTVESASSQVRFDVNQNNRLLYQEEVLKDGAGVYRLEVKGSTCASVQVGALPYAIYCKWSNSLIKNITTSCCTLFSGVSPL